LIKTDFYRQFTKKRIAMVKTNFIKHIHHQTAQREIFYNKYTFVNQIFSMGYP